MMQLPNQFFITGTDTDIGKTIVACMLTAGMSAVYWKPVQSGMIEESDSQKIARLSGLPKSHFRPESYRLQEPLSPHAAAEIDGISIELENIVLPDTGASPLIVEGAGGLMVPLNERYLMIDLIKQLDLPVLLVARSTLGTINHTLLSLQALRQADIGLVGVVVNGPQNQGNVEAIKQYGKIDDVVQVPFYESLDKVDWKSEFNRLFLPSWNRL